MWINSCLETDSITCIDSNGILFQAERTEEPWNTKTWKTTLIYSFDKNPWKRLCIIKLAFYHLMSNALMWWFYWDYYQRYWKDILFDRRNIFSYFQLHCSVVLRDFVCVRINVSIILFISTLLLIYWNCKPREKNKRLSFKIANGKSKTKELFQSINDFEQIDWRMYC